MRVITTKSLLLLVVLGLSACADMKGIAPTAVLRDAASFGLKASPADSPPGALVRPEWWRDFGDEGLNRLMAQALADNPNLKLARARLARAQAATQLANAALVGRPNMELAFSDNGLFAIKNVGFGQAIPADLLGRRADVMAARWRVEAASHDVVNAKRSFIPIST